MRIVWLAFAVLLTIAQGATSVIASEPTYSGRAVNWSGAYIGGYVGWGHADTKATDLTGEEYGPPGATMSLSENGVIGGLTLGYNFQRGAIVFGPEAELGFADINRLRDDEGSGLLTDYRGIAGSLALRLGYAFGPSLLYAKSGLAFAKIRSGGGEYDGPGSGQWGFDTNEAGLGDKTRFGWMIGAGVEHMIGANWSIKLEYTFSDFGTKTYTDPDGTGADFKFDDRLHSAKVGLNYRF